MKARLCDIELARSCIRYAALSSPHFHEKVQSFLEARKLLKNGCLKGKIIEQHFRMAIEEFNTLAQHYRIAFERLTNPLTEKGE